MNQLEGVFMDSGSGDLDDDKLSKKRRTNYRRPENAAKLNAAVNALIMQKQDPNAPKDIRSVSKIFNIPYNTLRDNYLRFLTSLFFFFLQVVLRVTTGDVRCAKKQKKQKDDDSGDDNGDSNDFFDGNLDQEGVGDHPDHVAFPYDVSYGEFPSTDNDGSSGKYTEKKKIKGKTEN
jgi:hypothetical protein